MCRGCSRRRLHTRFYFLSSVLLLLLLQRLGNLTLFGALLRQLLALSLLPLLLQQLLLPSLLSGLGLSDSCLIVHMRRLIGSCALRTEWKGSVQRPWPSTTGHKPSRLSAGKFAPGLRWNSKVLVPVLHCVRVVVRRRRSLRCRGRAAMSVLTHTSSWTLVRINATRWTLTLILRRMAF